MASCRMPKRKDLIEPWTDWITEPLPQEEKLQKINKWKWRGRDSIWSIKMEQTRNRARITYKQECETNPSHPDRELRRPAPRRKSAPTAPAAVSDLRRRPHVHRGSRRAGGRSSSMPEKLVAAAGRLLRRDMQRPG